MLCDLESRTSSSTCRLPTLAGLGVLSGRLSCWRQDRLGWSSRFTSGSVPGLLLLGLYSIKQTNKQTNNHPPIQFKLLRVENKALSTDSLAFDSLAFIWQVNIAFCHECHCCSATICLRECAPAYTPTLLFVFYSLLLFQNKCASPPPPNLLSSPHISIVQTMEVRT